jgi:hypothetical protein
MHRRKLSSCGRIPERAAITPLSYEEDDRQMEALLSLIAAKAGLLLVDLRVKDDQTHAE